MREMRGKERKRDEPEGKESERKELKTGKYWGKGGKQNLSNRKSIGERRGKMGRGKWR